LTSVSTQAIEEVFLNANKGKLENFDVPYISREDLLRAKKEAGRAKDIADVEELEKIRKIYIMEQIKLKDFSTHLFWDVDPDDLDLNKNKKLIIHRVLDYGLITDWECLYNFYGIDEIAKTAVNIRDLDKKSASFISLLSNAPLDKFACYTTKHLTQKHWNF